MQTDLSLFAGKAWMAAHGFVNNPKQLDAARDIVKQSQTMGATSFMALYAESKKSR